MTRLGSLTSPEVPSASVLVIPLGSVEQHGPHLPLDTDVRIAEAVAAGVVDADDRFVLGPTLPVGAAGEHAGFAGTLSIGTKVLTDVLVELRRGLGPEFDGLAVLNAHGGNAEALAAAEAICAEEKRLLRAWTICLPEADAHAGRTETSLMLAIDADTVRLDLAEPGPTETLGALMPRMRTGGLRAVSPNGVLGDPAGASAETGRAMLDVLVADAIAALSRVERAGDEPPVGRGLRR